MITFICLLGGWCVQLELFEKISLLKTTGHYLKLLQKGASFIKASVYLIAYLLTGQVHLLFTQVHLLMLICQQIRSTFYSMCIF